MRRPLSVVAGLGLGLLLLTSCGNSGSDRTAQTSSRTVDVSETDCGSGWQPQAAGMQDLVLHNTDQYAGEVQVVGRGSHDGLVYADVEPFGPGTTLDVHVPLAAGRYALACLMEDQAPVTGPTRAVTGSATGTPGVRILTQSQLVPATQRYEAWLRGHILPLVRDTHRLHGAVDAGDLVTARQDWLVAHLDYQRLGAAYDAFGDLGDTIDGLPSGLPGGTSNPDWTGFHRVELDLWVHPQAARVHDEVATLDHAAAQLPQLVRSARLDPLTLTLRAHEIAENALQFQLSGQDDYGSHTDLDSVRAELVGTGAVLRALAGPIDQRVAHPAQVRGGLRRTLAAFTRATRGEHHVAVDRLPREERERLDAALGLLTQQLAAIPATLEPRLTVASQTLGGTH
jgi:iron uptake system component EfeO